MDDRELEQLLADSESDRVERKASISDPDKIREAICAFANDLPDHNKPGVIFIGVDDSGRSTGLSISDQLLLSLGDMRGDGNIVPIPSMLVQKRALSAGEIATVIVEPADFPPVRYRGRVWIRVGPRRAIASTDDERRLTEKRRAGDLPFELRPAREATLADLDDELLHRVYLPSAVAADVLAQNERSSDHQLLAIRFATKDLVPTVLGLLVAGRDPTQFVPCAYVQFLRIDGMELGDPIRSANEIRGPVPLLVREADEVLKANIATAFDITSGPVEIRTPDFPLAAVQQILYNAVMHRSYEGTNAPIRLTWFNDRVEIQNPGGPFGQVNRRNFGQPGITDYRNLHLAGAMRELGFVQRFGVGIATAQREMARNGNPPIEFQVEDTGVLAILRRRP